MKKSLSLFFSVILIAACMLTCFASSYVKGDINGDGSVTAADARLALRYSARLEELTPRQIAAAAMSGSDSITAADARTVLRISARLDDYDDAKTSAVDAVLSSMSTEEKIAGMLMCSVRYFDEEPVTEINGSIADMLSAYPFAGVILFAQNTQTAEQTLRLTDALQNANRQGGRPQLFVAADQEGGKITRLATGTQTPGNMALGAIGDEEAARISSDIIGEELSSVGINVDFAPVMDVNVDPSNPVIGVRSFSDSPDICSALGGAYINGLQDNNVISALKHFPGHGDTGTDSHTGLPLIDKSYDTLKECELIPFAKGIAEGSEMIMTAHIQYPQIEKETYISKSTGDKICLPATLSKTIISDILRGDMGYDGVVVTDAMNMDAIATHFDRYDSARLAINAGVDIILMPVNTHSAAGIADLGTYIKKLAQMADSGEISMDKIDKANRRILGLKYDKGLFAAYDEGDLDSAVSAARETLGSAEHHGTEWELAKRAVTMVKNSGDTLPLKDGQKYLLLAAYPNEVLSMRFAVERLQSEGKLPSDAEFVYECYTSAEPSQLADEVRGADRVIAISELYRASALDPRTEAGAVSAGLDRLIDITHENGGKFVLISANLPYDTARYQNADALLVCWSDMGMNVDPRLGNEDVRQYGPNIPAAVYVAFSSEDSPSGRLPVNIPALTPEYTYSSELLYARGFGLSY